MSMLTLNSIVYTLNHFLNVIKATDLKYEITNWSESSLFVDFTCGKVSKTVVFRISNNDTVQSFLNKELKLHLYPTIDKGAMIPLMNDESTFSKIDSGILYVEADIISISFILLSRYEETLINERDSHGRFQFKNSLGNYYEFHKFPIVDEYCYLLKEQLKSLFFNIKFESKKVKIIPTHDIDEIQRFKGVYKSAKSILEDLYIYGSFKFFFNSIKSYFRSSLNPFNDMYLRSIYKLIEVSKKNGYVSEFYFMGADSGNNNDGYNSDSVLLKNVYAEIEQNKMIVGLHGGYMTYLDVNVYNKEKQRVESAINTSIKHNRQHYLRFDIENTFEVLEKANISYDTSLGYAEAEGFRCGTCHPYHPFDFKNDKPFKIWEKPLIVMDVTLSGYQKYNEIEALASMQQLYERCKVVEGDFVLLWHNNYVYREPNYFKNVYCKFLEFNKEITA
jgi:hypothetical protein